MYKISWCIIKFKAVTYGDRTLKWRWRRWWRRIYAPRN